MSTMTTFHPFKLLIFFFLSQDFPTHSTQHIRCIARKLNVCQQASSSGIEDRYMHSALYALHCIQQHYKSFLVLSMSPFPTLFPFCNFSSYFLS